MRWLIFMAGGVLLTSCASAPRDMSNAGLELPAAWTAGAKVGAPEGREWWRSFSDDQLSVAVSEALDHNRDLQAAVARLEAAEAQARIAGAELFPTLGAGFDASRSQRNFIGFPIPGGESDVLTTRTTTYGLSLNSSWELDLWGRVRASRRAARAEWAATAADVEGARNSIAAQTVKTWFAVSAARRQLALAESTAASYQSTADQVRDRYERGLRSPLDLRLAQANLESARALVSERALALDRAVRQLEILLGRYPAGGMTAGGSMPPLPPPVPAGVPAGLVGRRPDLAAAEKRLRAADSRVAQARASLYPRISLTAAGGTSTQELGDLLSSDFTVWNLAGNLAAPIFQGGRLAAGVDLAKARSRQAWAEFQGAALNAFREVESGLSAERALATQEEFVSRAVEQSVAARELAEQRYRAGLEDFIAVLEAQRRALEAETRLVTVRRLRLESRADLHLALGGGFTVEGVPLRSKGEKP